MIKQNNSNASLYGKITSDCCGEKISPNALFCPYCGSRKPFSDKHSFFTSLYFTLLMVAVTLAAAGGIIAIIVSNIH